MDQFGKCKTLRSITSHIPSVNPGVCRPITVNHQSDLSLRWRHNDQDGVSNHQLHGCLLNRLFRRRSNKTSKLRVTGLCVGKSPGPVNSPHKGPVTRKMFQFDDVIMVARFHPMRQDDMYVRCGPVKHIECVGDCKMMRLRLKRCVESIHNVLLEWFMK